MFFFERAVIHTSSPYKCWETAQTLLFAAHLLQQLLVRAQFEKRLWLNNYEMLVGSTEFYPQ